MGAGGKEVSLDVFESHLKKLLHIIDKLPKVEREKAVLILRNSANHYSNLTTGHPLQPPPTCSIFSTLPSCNQALSEIPVSQVTKTFDLLKDEALGKQSQHPEQSQQHLEQSQQQLQHPEQSQQQHEQSQHLGQSHHNLKTHHAELGSVILENQTVEDVISDKSESQAILEEIGGLGDEDTGVQDGFMEDEEDWDQHILEIQNQGRINRPDPSLLSDTSMQPARSHPTDSVSNENSALPDTSVPLSNPENNLSASETVNTSVSGFPEFERIETDAPSIVEKPATNNECKLCFKRMSDVPGVTCKVCRLQVCGQPCLLVHAQECSQSGEVQLNSGTPRTDGKKSKQDYWCSLCNKYFLTSCTLKTHMEGHAKNDCDKCSTRCATRRILVSHMKEVHFINIAEKYYACRFCSRKFVKKPSLWFHYSTHATGTQVVCHKCGEFLENQESMDKHTANHKSTQLSCDRCGEFFSRRQQYNLHIKTHDDYACTLCTKAFSSKKRLSVHKVKEHPSKGERKAGKGASTNPSQAKPNEQKVEELGGTKPLKSFKCGFCVYENKNYKKVMRHERRHKNLRKFVCELCGNAFNTEYTLKEHTAYVHSDERKFKCFKCDKSFKAKNALIRHEQVHTEQRQFRCHCGKSYKRQSHLNRHFSASSHGYSTNPDPTPESDMTEPMPTVAIKPEYSGITASSDIWMQGEDGFDKKISSNQCEVRSSSKLEVKSESLLGYPPLSSSSSSLEYMKMTTKVDSRRMQYNEKVDELEKIKYYKIPKKYSSPQKYSYFPEKPLRTGFPELGPGPGADTYRDPSRNNHLQSSKYQYDNPVSKPHYPPLHNNQRHFQSDLQDRGNHTSSDRMVQNFQDKFHTSEYPDKNIPEMDRDFFDRYPGNHDKMDYSSSLPEKTYQDFSDDKNYILPVDLEERQISQAGGTEKSFLPLDDRFFQSSIRDLGYTQGLEQRLGGSVNLVDLRPDSVFPESGPADLTITSKDVSNNRTDSRDYFSGVHPSLTSSSRHSFNKPRPSSPHSSGSRMYSESQRNHFMSPRSQPDPYRSSELFRPSHSDTRNQGSSNELEVLEENSYRSLHDLGYSRQQQNHYYDQIDPYVLLPRGGGELEENYDKRHKYYRQDKYPRTEELNLLNTRQDGGILPPLLALNPSLPPGHNPAPSPPSMKLDYICSPNDNLSSQYMPDATLDYY